MGKKSKFSCEFKLIVHDNFSLKIYYENIVNMLLLKFFKKKKNCFFYSPTPLAFIYSRSIRYILSFFSLPFVYPQLKQKNRKEKKKKKNGGKQQWRRNGVGAAPQFRSHLPGNPYRVIYHIIRESVIVSNLLIIIILQFRISRMRLRR